MRSFCTDTTSQFFGTTSQLFGTTSQLYNRFTTQFTSSLSGGSDGSPNNSSPEHNRSVENSPESQSPSQASPECIVRDEAHSKKHPDYPDELAHKALESHAKSHLNRVKWDAFASLKKTGPHHYSFTDTVGENEWTGFIAMGCHGKQDTGPLIKLLTYINDAVAPLYSPFAVVGLGDNFYAPNIFYNDGLSDPHSDRFNEEFYKIFKNPEFKQLAHLPVIALLGNHDGNYTKKTHKFNENKPNIISNIACGELVEANQVAASYLLNQSGYVDDTKNEPTNIAKREILFRAKNIGLDQLPAWMMPYFFYSYDIGNVDNAMRVFMLNSNSLAKDCLNLLTTLITKDDTFFHPDHYDATHASSLGQYLMSKIEQMNRQEKTRILKNQMAFLIKGYLEVRAKASKWGVIIAQHNPTLDSLGKRFYPHDYDTKFYLSKIEIVKLFHVLKALERLKQLNNDSDENARERRDCLLKIKNILHLSDEELNKAIQEEKIENPSVSLGALICLCYEVFGVVPDLFLNAHDHFGALYNNKQDPHADYQACQVTMGASTYDLHARLNYGNAQNVGFFLNNEQACAVISWKKNNPTLIQIDVHTITGRHLRFTNQSPEPIIAPRVHDNIQHDEQQKVAEIRLSVRRVCARYQAYLHRMQTEKHGRFFATKMHDESVKDMHDLLNAVNNHEPQSSEELLDKIGEIHAKKDVLNYYLQTEKALMTMVEAMTQKKMDELIQEFDHVSATEENNGRRLSF